MSTGRSESGLCPTRNRPAHIGWEVKRSAVDRRKSRVESDRAPVDNGRVGRSRSEFQPPNLRRKSLNLHWISPNLCCIFARSVDFSSDLCDNHDIKARKTTSSLDLNENFHLIAGSSPYLHWIFAGSVDFSSDLCDNHGIEAKNTTSSPNLSENFYLIAGSNQKLWNLHRIWVDLGRPGLLSRVSSVGSGSSGFGKGNPLSDPPKSVFQGKDPSPTVTDVGSAGFRVGPSSLGGWVSFRFLVDSPKMCIFIDFWKLETENSFFHVFSYFHKLSFDNSFCFLSILGYQTNFLISIIENYFWKQKIRKKGNYQTYP